jgi:hypothetical protein
MKRLFSNGIRSITLALLVASGTSCSKTAFDPPQPQPDWSAKSTVTKVDQEETFYSDCCGEDVTLSYTVNVVESGNGFHFSTSGITGYGHTTGNVYHGVMYQGGTFQPNNYTMVFTTILRSTGCGLTAKTVLHATFDSEGNVVVSKDAFSVECSGND